jgi:MFS transporter, DHA2 family, multidrug resistance protein
MNYQFAPLAYRRAPGHGMTLGMLSPPVALDAGRCPPRSGADLRSAALLGALALSFACVALDNTKLTLAVPTLARALQSSPGGGHAVRWIVEANLVVYTALLLLGGALTERIGARRASLVGLGSFMAGSCATAAAGSTLALFGARAVVGAGAALMTPASLAAIQQAFTGAARTRAVAIWTASFAAATAVGPLLGGVLLERWGFGALMMSNVPLAALASCGVFTLVPAGALRRRPLAVGPAAPRPAPRERRLRPAAETRGPLTRALLVILLSYLAFSGLSFAVAQYWQLVRLHAPSAASLWNLPLPLAMLVGTLSAPRAMRRWGAARALAGSLVVALLGAALVGLAGSLQSDLALCVALLPFAAGAGSAFPNATETLLSFAPPERAGTAAALSETAFELGGVLGIGALGMPFHSLAPGEPAPSGAAAWAGAIAVLAFALALALTRTLSRSERAPRALGDNALEAGRS